MKNQYIGRDCQKSWLGQFADLQSGLVKKMGEGWWWSWLILEDEGIHAVLQKRTRKSI